MNILRNQNNSQKAHSTYSGGDEHEIKDLDFSEVTIQWPKTTKDSLAVTETLVVLQEGDHGLDTTPLLQNTQTQKILFSRGGDRKWNEAIVCFPSCPSVLGTFPLIIFGELLLYRVNHQQSEQPKNTYFISNCCNKGTKNKLQRSTRATPPNVPTPPPLCLPRVQLTSIEKLKVVIK